VEELTLKVVRDAGTQGNVSAIVEFRDETSVKGLDYWGLNGQGLYWDDGDSSDREIKITIIQDARPEPAEYFKVVITGLSGGAMLGNITEVRVEIRANNFTGNTDKLAVEVKFRLTKSIDSLPELSQERAQFENWCSDIRTRARERGGASTRTDSHRCTNTETRRPYTRMPYIQHLNTNVDI